MKIVWADKTVYPYGMAYGLVGGGYYASRTMVNVTMTNKWFFGFVKWLPLICDGYAKRNSLA